MSLPAFTGLQVLAHHPHFLHVIWLNLTDLFVYRSPLVRDTSPEYQVVVDLLNSQQHHILSSRVIQDTDMMFGEAHETIYRMGVKV